MMMRSVSKKFVAFSFLFISSALAACSHQTSSKTLAEVPSDEVSGAALTVWLGIAPENVKAESCLKRAQKSFLEVQFLSKTGVFILTTPTISDAAVVEFKKAGCITDFELEVEATIQKRKSSRPSEGNFTGSAVTIWNAVLPAAGLTDQCRAQAANLGLEVVQALELVGIVTLRASNIGTQPLLALRDAKCITDFELDQEATIAARNK